MAARYEVDDALGIVVVLIDDDTEAWEVAETFDHVLRDPRVGPGFHFVSDQRGCTRHSGPGSLLSAIAVLRQYRARLTASRVAIPVHAEDLARLNLTSVADVFTEHSGVTVRLFDDCDAAAQWASNIH